MRFRLLEAPSALGSDSRTNSKQQTPKSALGSTSRSNPTAKPEQSASNPEKNSTFVPKTPEDWERILYDSNHDRAFREIACVKWLENNKPSSPLLSLMKELRNQIKVFDSKIGQAQDDTEARDEAAEEAEDITGRATDSAVEKREINNLIKQSSPARNKVKVIFNAIFEAIDCKSDVFENIIAKLDLVRLPQSFYGNLVSLANTVAEDTEFDTEKDYLLNLSLYNRPAQDFVYTLKVLNIVYDPIKLVKYYDPKKVSLKHLFDGKDIKPAGISAKDPKDFNTIYGVLEIWKETAANENTDKPVKNNKKDEYEFSSFEEAEKQSQAQDGNVITINGKFKFDGDNKKWEPVEK